MQQPPARAGPVEEIKPAARGGGMSIYERAAMQADPDSLPPGMSGGGAAA